MSLLIARYVGRSALSDMGWIVPALRQGPYRGGSIAHLGEEALAAGILDAPPMPSLPESWMRRWLKWLANHLVPSRKVAAYLVVTGVLGGSVYYIYQISPGIVKDIVESTVYQRAKSAFTHWWNFSGSINLNPEHRRLVMKNLYRLETKVPVAHSHGAAAMERNAATEMMLHAVTACGLEPYVIAPSPRERDRAGCRPLLSYADLSQKFRDDPITERSVFVMTDVDYYVDMPALLSYGLPVLCYTFSPQTAAGPVKDGFFTIVDNQVVYKINGGKREYRHGIWDYNMDVVGTEDVATTWYQLAYKMLLRMVHPIQAVFGFRPQVWGTLSHVDQVVMSKHRRIVCITPFSKTYISLLDGNMLRRCSYRATDATDPHSVVVYNGVNSEGEITPVISIAREGEFATASLPLEKYNGVVAAHQCANSKHLSDTQRRSGLDVTGSAILHRYLLAQPLKNLHPQLVHRPGLAQHYTMKNRKDTPQEILETPKEYARTFAPPVVSNVSVYPTECEANTIGGVAGRVLGPQLRSNQQFLQTLARTKEGDKSGLTFTRLARYADEFVRALIPEELAGTGVPIPVQEVDDRQDRTAQRVRSSQRTMSTDEPFQVLAFQKREAYAVPNDPRNISQVPTTHTLRLSGFTYAFKEQILKKQPWYTPCRTPTEIAQQLSDIAATSEELLETDFSRFDGHINEWTRRAIEFAAYLRWVSKDHRAELIKLLEAELYAPARTKAGKYDPGCSRLSGSPPTTDGNTMIDFFVIWAAHREEAPQKSAEEAFHHVGKKCASCGDDCTCDGALASDLNLIRVASSMGLSLKIEKRSKRGDSVSYLSRVFPDIWASPASHQAALRACSKLHTTSNTTHDIDEMGIAKATGYLVTDSMTPLISDWCRAYLAAVRRNLPDDHSLADSIRISGLAREALDITQVNADGTRNDLLADLPYWSRLADQRASPWPQEGIDLAPTVAAGLGIDVGTLMDHCKLLRAHTGDVASLPTLQLAAAPPKVDAIVDGEIHEAGSTIVVENGKPKPVGTSNEQQSGAKPGNSRSPASGSGAASATLHGDSGGSPKNKRRRRGTGKARVSRSGDGRDGIPRGNQSGSPREQLSSSAPGNLSSVRVSH